MKKNLKLLIPSLMIALTLLAAQAIYSMEDFSKPIESAPKKPYVLKVSRDSDITEESPQEKGRGEQALENPFKRWCSEDIKFLILECAAIDNYLSYGNTYNLRCVCKDWRRIMKQDAMKKSMQSIKHEIIYQRFLKGVLIYRPNPTSDEGIIKLPIKDLSNPLEETFDLSRCGDAAKYLSISTGYQKKNKPENANKLEIWLAPRFLIEKELATTAKHFQETYSNWKDEAPVGIFWTWDGWCNLKYYDYLITKSMANLSKISLYSNWWDSQKRRPSYNGGCCLYTTPDIFHLPERRPVNGAFFYVHFMS